MNDRMPTPRPWMEYHRGWLLCMMCPMDKITRNGQYYRGIRTSSKTRAQVRRWVYTHHYCGFKGLR